MILERLTLINYKNIREASLELSPKINCMIGRNGVGKTNILDAVYFLSFCHSASNPIDSQVIRHDEEFLFVEGIYSRKEEGGKRKENTPATDNTSADSSSDSASNISPSSFLLPLSSKISCGMKRGSKKHFRRDKKEYRRLSEHIGLIPLVMVSPADTLLIDGGSEERRRLMDMVISQYDRPYMESVGRYNKALLQRNALLKQEEEPDAELLGLWEEQMAAEGERIYQRRDAFVRELTPIFQRYYERISDCREQV
ncbi:MAG: DNA replication/repair protein RecF, partial [Prevotella sp.]|nr:DNA replication/repair protein RecF [Prevotella sp.]